MNHFETSKEAEAGADAVESKQLKTSSYSLWPSIFVLFLFLAGLLIYSDQSSLFLYLMLACCPIMGLYSVLNLLLFRLKNSISYGIPTIVISIMVLFGLHVPIGKTIVNFRHHVQFFLGKNKYESEVKKLKEAGIFYKEWPWGTQGGIQYDLIYDASDKSAVPKPENKKSQCLQTILKLETHFYVRRDFCP